MSHLRKSLQQLIFRQQHDLPAHLSNILVPVSKTEQEVWQHMDNVGLKQFSQHITQHLKGKQRPCNKPKINRIL